jgi:WD40-like Beta Propeller Repeat
MNRLRTLSWMVALACGLAVPGSGAAQVRPNAAYREMETEHFRATFGPGLEAIAVRALAAAEQTHSYLVRTLSRPPKGRIDIVIVDDVDFSNGFASPFPSNRITIYARPPVDDEALSFSPDWIELVVSHEVTHVFHLDRAGGVGRLMRSVFGRLPLIYPMFPAVSTPRWSTEGLAVDVESGFTGFGRLHGNNHEMVVRTAVLEGRMDRMDRLNERSPMWPGDQRVYIYGSLFMEYLSKRYGEDVHRELLDRTASAFLPPFLFFDNVAKRTFGESFDDAYAAWRAELQTKYSHLADSLRASGLTSSERVSKGGRWAIHPRVSPDGSRLAWTADDGRDVPVTRIVDAVTGRELDSHRRNGLSSQSWTPQGALVLSQLEFDGPYRIFSDLWIVGPGSRRLTNGDRVQDADVSRDGRRIVAIQNGGGAARLVRVDPATGVVRVIGSVDADVLWSFPRWSPDGTRIAVGRWSRGGRYDIVIVDTTGTVLSTVASGRSLNMEPAWSPDGRYVVFSSDRTGIANLYAADISNPTQPRLMQITNVLTGAFFPEVSPDGKTLFFSAYHADGYAIEKMPFDAASWREPAGESSLVTTPAPETEAAPGATAAPTASRRFNPWRSVAPTYWQPMAYGSAVAGTFIGATTIGQDLVGRHTYSAFATVDAEGSGRWEAGLNYTNARFGNPLLGIEASRSWDDLGVVRIPAGTTGDSVDVGRLERDDVVTGLLTLVRRRWRNFTSVSVGLEREQFTLGAVSSRPIAFRDKRDRFWTLLGRASFSTARQPAYAISREDGITLGLSAKRAIEDAATTYGDSTGSFPEDYNEVRAAATAYRSLDVGGFAHHVLALRAATFLSTGPGARLQSAGGSSGGVADVLGYGISAGSRLLPVRGFEAGALRGTHGWSATGEWRIPIAMIGRRPTLSPLFIDRISLAGFVDAADVWCTTDEQAVSATCRRNETFITPIVGAGAELVLDVGFAGIFTGRLRGGFGTPVRGPDLPQRFWIQFGTNF